MPELPDAGVFRRRLARKGLNRRKGGECPKCGRALETEAIGGRTTYYCPRDQRRRT